MKIALLRRSVASAGVLVLGMALGGCATTCGLGAGAGGPPPPPERGPMMPPPGERPDPAFHEALKACAQAQGIALPEPGAGKPAEAGKSPEAGARPDHEKLDACLKEKGIERPAGPPPGRHPGPGFGFGGPGGPGGFGGPGGPGGPGPGPGMPPPRDPAVAAAFKACAAEQGVQLPEPGDKPAEGGKPPFEALDHGKLETCMSGKGFKRPGPGEPDGKRPAASAAP